MTRKFILASLIMLFSFGAFAQMSPVTWTFTAKKTGDKTYEVEMKATIQDRWHLYSQKQPDDAIAIPTSFTFNPNPLFKLDDKLQEVGAMEKFSDKNLGVSANQYTGTVTFVQKVKMKANAKTNLTGTVEYQTCDDKKCLPPKTVPFNIPLR
jgi:hypothetical protein